MKKEKYHWRSNYMYRHAYPVLNTIGYDNVWLIPAAATHIFIKPSVTPGSETITFDIYADVRQKDTTNMLHCGSFYLDIQRIFKDDLYYYERDVFEDIAERCAYDTRFLAESIAEQISHNAEVDCERLVEEAYREFTPLMTEAYKELKNKKKEMTNEED